MNFKNISMALIGGAVLCAPWWVAAQTVTSFTVVNADTGADIATFTSSGTLSLRDTPNINVRANTSADVRRVVFSDNQGSGRTENVAPFAYRGDRASGYFSWRPTAGTHQIVATPFSGTAGNAPAGPAATLSLTLTNAPAPVSSASVTSFTVFNAVTGADIATFPSSGTISLRNSPKINVRANTSSGVVRVVFTDNNGLKHAENAAPFSYRGDSSTGYATWSPGVGTYRIAATPFSGSRTDPQAGTTATLALTIADTPVPPPPSPGNQNGTNASKPATRDEAARFLAQATFGPTDDDIDRLMSLGYADWIDEQLKAPLLPRASHEAKYRADSANHDPNRKPPLHPVYNSFWKQALTGPDQLRQRMAYALSQIFVISIENNSINDDPRAVAAYLDMLGKHSFGDFRSLLEDVALHPQMGIYLTHIANQKGDPAAGRIPDQNFAREIMQLFTIGLVELNEDGSARTGSNGAPLESYGPEDVAGLSHVFTGWSWDCPSWPSDNCFYKGSTGPGNKGARDSDRNLKRMRPYAQFHSTEPKSFLGTTIAAQQSANPSESLRLALNHLVAHPNVGPFIGRQLIQRFTTSNPSPAYVKAVAQAFANNGNGVRGDLGAVLKAILLHPEARVTSNTSGKVREPVLRMSAFMRAFSHRSSSGEFRVGNTDSPSNSLAQTPLRAPSVFNFYRPGYVAPGSQSAARSMVAPELQITSELTLAGYVNAIENGVASGISESNNKDGSGRDMKSDFAPELALAEDVPALVDRVTSRLTYGAAGPALRNEIIRAVSSISISTTNPTRIAAAKRSRVNAAILLTMAAPEFVVLK